MKSTFFSIILVFILLASCQKTDPLDNMNLNHFGGQEKNFSFEAYGDFYNYTFYLDKFNSDDSSGSLIPPLALPNARIAIITENSSFFKLYEKNIEVSSKLREENLPISSMVADKHGNYFYISVSRELISLDDSGQMRWRYSLSDSNNEALQYTEILISDGSLFFGDNQGLFYAFSTKGKLEWKHKFFLPINKTISMTKSGKIAITLTNDEFGKSDKLVFISKVGQIIFEKDLKGFRLFRSPSIFEDKLIIIGIEQIDNIRKNLIICIDTLGNEVWRKSIDLFPRYSSVSNDGLTYIVAYNSGLGEPLSAIYCLDKKGEESWKLYYDVTIKSPIMISENKIAFLGIKKQLTAMFFLKKDGTILNHISLNDAPLFNSIPTVRSDGVICFAGVKKLQIIRLDDTFLNKLLPW